MKIKIEIKVSVKKKITDHDHVKYIITQEFIKLTAENFTARLKLAILEWKADFGNKLISFNRKIISDKTTYSDV